MSVGLVFWKDGRRPTLHAVKASLSSLFRRTSWACFSWRKKGASAPPPPLSPTFPSTAGGGGGVSPGGPAHLLLQALHHGGQVSHPVLLDLLHLQLELLLGHAAEVAVLLHGPQQHVALVLPLLGQGLEDLRLLGLQGWRRRWGETEARGNESASLTQPTIDLILPQTLFPSFNTPTPFCWEQAGNARSLPPGMCKSACLTPKLSGRPLTLLRSSAASSFFWMSSRDRSLFGGLVTQWAASVTGDDGFRRTSKAWPEARLLMGLMSRSARDRRVLLLDLEEKRWETTQRSAVWWTRTFKVPQDVFAALGVQTGADEREN